MRSFIFLSLALLTASVAAQVLEPQTPYKILKKQDGSVASVAFSGNGQLLATGSDDKTCVIWSFPDCKEATSIAGLNMGIKGLVFMPDNQSLCLILDRFVRTFKTSGQPVSSFAASTTGLFSLALNPVTMQISVGSYEKAVRLFDYTTGKSTFTSFAHKQNVLAVAFSSDGKLLASGSLDQTIKIWDVATTKELYTLTGHFGNIYSLAFTPDSRKLVSSSADKTIRLWDIASGKWIRTFTGHEDLVVSVAVSPDGQEILSGSYDHSAKLWNISSGECIFTTDKHNDAVLAVAFHPSGKYFATASKDKSTMIWELRPEIFAAFYYPAEINAEAEASGLFAPKSKSEQTADYKKRQEKANAFKAGLIEKYYQKYLSEKLEKK
jgi:WD40 repeat protein